MQNFAGRARRVFLKKKSGHGCNTQVGSRNLLRGDKNDGYAIKTTQVAQLPVPLCQGQWYETTVGGLLWLFFFFFFQLDREKIILPSIVVYPLKLLLNA